MRSWIWILTIGLVLAAAGPATAQHVDVTVFAGQAFPAFDGRLVLRAPAVPSLPGVEVTATGVPELRADGGLVAGGAVAVELGVLAVEGRLDTVGLGFDASGARYDLLATSGPLTGLAGSVTIGDGRFDLDRLALASLNLRLRTPGPVGLVVSGGLSYLPDIRVRGSVPLDVQAGGLTVLPAIEPRLTLVATPDQAAHRWGVNAGAGLRIGGRVALVAEARVFYFGSYALRFALENPLPFLNDLISSVDSIRFRPVFVNAQAGLNIRF